MTEKQTAVPDLLKACKGAAALLRKLGGHNHDPEYAELLATIAKEESGVCDEEKRQRLIAKARELWQTDETEIDDDARISEAGDGNWVQAWVWVSDEEFEPCDGCDGTGIRPESMPHSGPVPDGFVVVERCDTCQRFPSDLDAARAWGGRNIVQRDRDVICRPPAPLPPPSAMTCPPAVVADSIRCIVACTNRDGAPDFFPVIIRCFSKQYDNGDHYDAAKDGVAGEGPYIVFDENDGPDWLFERFDWERVHVVDIRE